MLFLESAVASDAVVAGGIFAGFLVIWIILILSFVLMIFAGLYVYSSLAFVKIAKRLGRTDGAIAWIPIVGKPLLSSRIAKKPWWPILFLTSVFLFFIPIFGVVLIIGCFIAFSVFYYIWRWYVFEAVGRPGWWILLGLIPNAGAIIYLVLLGVAAWGEEDKKTKRKIKR